MQWEQLERPIGWLTSLCPQQLCLERTHCAVSSGVNLYKSQSFCIPADSCWAAPLCFDATTTQHVALLCLQRRQTCTHSYKLRTYTLRSEYMTHTEGQGVGGEGAGKLLLQQLLITNYSFFFSQFLLRRDLCLFWRYYSQDWSRWQSDGQRWCQINSKMLL